MYRLPYDKAQHFFYGALGSAAGAILAIVLGVPAQAGPAALAFAFVVGLGKEIADHRSNRAAEKAGLAPPHEVSLADLGFTVLGAAPVTLAFIVMRVFHG